MKKVLILAALCAGALGAYAQTVGQLEFNNKVGIGVLLAQVYGLVPTNNAQYILGQTSSDYPVGATTYNGAPLIGGTNAGPMAGNLYNAQLFAAPGTDTTQTLSNVVSTLTTFKTVNSVAQQGFIIQPPGASTLVPGTVAGGNAVCQMRVWYNGGNTNLSWDTASTTPGTPIGFSSVFVVTNLGGTPLSGNPVTPPYITNLTSFNLFIVTPLSIGNPANVTGYCGGNAVISVPPAAGTPPIAYQWYRGATMLVNNGTTITGSTSPNLTLLNTTMGESGQSFTVVTSNNGSPLAPASGSVTSSVPAVLTVLDTPVVTIIGATTTNIECSSSFTDPGATATGACQGGPYAVTTNGVAGVHTGTVGTYLITYSATSGSDTVSAIRTVIVGDTTPPVITMIGASTTNISVCSTFVDPGATANDTCAGVLTVTTNGAGAVSTVSAATFLITYIASDPSGNSATNVRTVNVTTTVPPIVTITGSSTVSVQQCSTYTEQGATSSDYCGNVLSVTSSGSVNASTLGTYLITYSATDTNSNTGTSIRTVHVTDTIVPVVTLNGSSTMSIIVDNSFVDPGATATNDCGSVSVVASGTVNTSVVNTYLVTYTATDANSVSGTAVRTVNVTLPSGPIEISPVNVTSYVGAEGIGFTVTPTYPSGNTYQWYKSTGAKIGGATSATYTLPGKLTAGSGATSYYVSVSNNAATPTIINSTNVSVTVETAVSVKTKPKPATVVAGNNVTFITAGNGTHLTYQWSCVSNSVTTVLPNQTNATISLTDVQTGTATYNCTINGDATVLGGETAPVATATLTVSEDASVTKVTISTPKNKSDQSNAVVTVSGKITDKGLITGVSVVSSSPVSPTTSSDATLYGLPTKQTYTNTSVHLADGTNTITVTATNSDGFTYSASNTVFNVNYLSLAINTNDAPGVTFVHKGSTKYGEVDSSVAVNGNTFSLADYKVFKTVATAGAGCIFSNWIVNGVISNDYKGDLAFMMVSNLSVTINAPSNPIANLAGNYNGMVSPTNGLTNAAVAGTISIDLKGTFAKGLFPFTGKTDIGGTAGTVSGGFDINGNFTGTDNKSHAVVMSIDWTSGSNQIYGTVGGVPFQAGLEFTGTSTNLATGTYYLPIPATVGANTVYGYATIAVGSGGVTIAGKTMEGTAFTATTTVDQYGRIPFYPGKTANLMAAALSPANTNELSGSIAVNDTITPAISLISGTGTNSAPASATGTLQINGVTVPIGGALYPQAISDPVAGGIVTLSYKASLHAPTKKGYGIWGGDGFYGSINLGSGPEGFTIK